MNDTSDVPVRTAKPSSTNDRPKNNTMECLLKQVYAVHRAKILKLEKQINDLQSMKEENAKLDNRCIQCEELRASMDDLVEKYALQLEEKDCTINALRSQLESVTEVKEAQEVTVKHKLNLKRKIENGAVKPSKTRRENVPNVGQERCGEDLDDDDVILVDNDATEISVERVKPLIMKNKTTDVQDSESHRARASTPVILVPDTFADSPLHIDPVHERAENVAETSCSFETMSGVIESRKKINNTVNKITKNVEGLYVQNKSLSRCKKNFERLNGDVNKSFEDFVSCELNDDECSRQSKEQKNNDNPGTTVRNGDRSPTKKRGVDGTSAKYPLYFEAAPKGYRKPKYKQTTLTQDAFAGATTFQDVDIGRALCESLVSYEQQRNKVESTEGSSKTSSTSNDRDEMSVADRGGSLDETYLPSQYLRRNNSEHAITVEDKMEHVFVELPDLLDKENRAVVKDDDSELAESEDLLQDIRQKQTERMAQNKRTIGEEISKQSFSTGPPTEQSLSDFDEVPSKKQHSPQYKFKRNTVRRQDDRRKLDGHECRECEAYFEVAGLTTEEKKQRLKACSRHRDKYVAPNTPEHFWSVGFPTTQQCKERGVLECTQYRPLQSRRRHHRD